MTSMKTTKKSLLISALALLLCFAMMIGTTFAWFTDSVSSANNIIASGNLDIELDYWNGSEWVTVKDSSEILDKEALWEPGYTEVVYLRLENAGSLALKYQLGVNIISETKGVNAAGEEFLLSDYIYFDVVEGVDGETEAFDTREEAMEYATENDKISVGFTKAETLLAGSEPVYLAMIVYMPTTVGNEANHNGTAPEIELGISVFATQMASEEDSFGSDYDVDAWHPDMVVYTAEDLSAALATGGNIELASDIVLDAPIVVPASETSTFALRSNATVLNLKGYTITTAYNASTQKHQYAIDNYGNLVIVGGTIEARGVYNREGATLTVNGTKIVNLDTNGGSSIWSYGGSVVLNNAHLIGYTGCVYSLGDLEINGGTYTCYSSVLDDGTQITPTYTIRSYGELVINGGDFTSRHGLLAIMGDNAVINGGTYTMTSIGVITSHVFYVAQDGAQVTVNGGEFNCDLRTAQNNGSSMFCVDATDVNVNVYGGVYNLSPAKYAAEGYKAIETANGWEIIPSDCDYVADGVLVSLDGQTYYISNRAGYAWMDAQADNFFGKKTIKLTADIDFGGETITGIKFWNSQPTIDGQGHTLSNFVIAHSGSKSPSGLFQGTLNVKNVVVDGANVTGDYAGGISGNIYGNIDNCTVKNSTITSTYWQAGGIVAQFNNGNVTNCTVENSTISGGAAVGGLVGILNETAGERKVENSTVKNCAIVQNTSFGGIYDSMFGAAIGLINIENSTVYIDGCTVEGNTVKGVASNELYGRMAANTIAYVDGVKHVVVSTMTELDAALKNGAKVIDARGANLGDFDYSAKFTDGSIIKNAKFTYFYGGYVTGTVTFVNCEFVSDHSYSGNFDSGNGNIIFNNCYFDGWNSFGTAITNVEMNNCTFDWNNPYSMLRFYQNAQLNNCTFLDIDGIDNGEVAGTTVELNNCTGIEGKIYNNTVKGTVMVSTWIVDGVVLTDVPAW